MHEQPLQAKRNSDRCLERFKIDRFGTNSGEIEAPNEGTARQDSKVVSLALFGPII